MGFVYVDHEKISKVCVVNGQSTDVVKGLHERRSGTAAEDEDKWPGVPLEFQKTPSYSVQTDKFGVERWTAMADCLACLDDNISVEGLPRLVMHQLLIHTRSESSKYYRNANYRFC